MPTRTKTTERAYMLRAKRFIASNGGEGVDPRDMVAIAIAKKPGWTKSTWRQIKASLKFFYEQMQSEKAASAVSLLDAENESGCKKSSANTSARRLKQVPDDVLAEVLTAVRLSYAAYAPVLEIWLRLGLAFGLRPHEWSQAEVIYLNGKPYLRVLNSKNTNGRAHGEYRHLDLSECDKTLIDTADQFIAMMRNAVADGGYKLIYGQCAGLLRRINKKLYGQKGKWLQLYSPRHKFSSNAKAVASVEEIAALMGHATNKTATIHYGRRVMASGGISVKPIQEEVGRIRQANPGRDGNASARPDVTRNSSGA